MSESSIRDQRHYEPQSPEEIEQEFAGWHVWRGVNRLWYARLEKASPPVTVERREDLMDVRDGIIMTIRRRGWKVSEDAEDAAEADAAWEEPGKSIPLDQVEAEVSERSE